MVGAISLRTLQKAISTACAMPMMSNGTVIVVTTVYAPAVELVNNLKSLNKQFMVTTPFFAGTS
jgi:uncharacterized membrane protein